MTIKTLRARLWENKPNNAAGCAPLTARVAGIVVREFSANNCMLRASTLTFYTLLAIVPLLATVFGIVKGSGLRQILQRVFAYQTGWQHDLAVPLFAFSSTALADARAGLITGSGVIALFVSVVGMLGVIEEAFNAIWKVDEGRRIARRVADYLSLVMVGTVLLAVSVGVSVFITAYVQFVAQEVPFLVPASRTLMGALNIVPFIVNWFLFSFVYLVMPNTAVPFSAGVIAGIIAGTVFQLVQGLYLGFQVSISHYGAVYGGFAALPLFLVWLQMSWVIVLLGGEFSYAIGNRRTYVFHKKFSNTCIPCEYYKV